MSKAPSRAQKKTLSEVLNEACSLLEKQVENSDNVQQLVAKCREASQSTVKLLAIRVAVSNMSLSTLDKDDMITALLVTTVGSDWNFHLDFTLEEQIKLIHCFERVFLFVKKHGGEITRKPTGSK